MSDSLFEIYIHIVFGVNIEGSIIPEEILPQLHKYISRIFAKRKCHDICVGGISNHVHILTSLPKDVFVPEIVKKIKIATNKILWEKYKVNRFSWQKGYAVFSVGPRDLPKVKRYINNQKKHHIQTSYEKEIERLKFLSNLSNY